MVSSLSLVTRTLEHAEAISAKAVRIMAGTADCSKAHEVLIQKLLVGPEVPQFKDITILIEPLNQLDASVYFLGKGGFRSDAQRGF